MKLLVATGNAGKLREFARILTPLGIEAVSPQDVGIICDVEEIGETFAENAEIKARATYALARMPVVADDSGLCIDALGGRPGVKSARYLGDAPQPEKNAAILRELADVPDKKRAAHFACAICCILADDAVIACEGRCDGSVAYEPSGGNGFGYDPLFLVGGKSFGALSDAEKDELSHRGKALRLLAKQLEAYLKSGENHI